MFIGKYVDKFYFGLICDKYSKQYLNSLDEDNFIKIYILFKSYNFYYVKDIILNYLEIFSMEYDDVLNGIEILKEKLGENFINVIGNNMTYLDEIINF